MHHCQTDRAGLAHYGAGGADLDLAPPMWYPYTSPYVVAVDRGWHRGGSRHATIRYDDIWLAAADAPSRRPISVA